MFIYHIRDKLICERRLYAKAFAMVYSSDIYKQSAQYIHINKYFSCKYTKKAPDT